VVASGEYEQPISSSTKLFAGADTVFRSRIRYVTESTSAVTFKPHFVTGVRVGAQLMDDRFAIALYGRNLFNVHEPILRYGSSQLTGIAAPGSSTYTQYLTEASFRAVGLSGRMTF
jgi:iron complex outermembrane receptor protein